MVVRDTPAPSGRTTLEVLMVRRNLRSDFVGGAYVFPGGAVDLLDGGAEAEALSVGRSDAEASTLLGVESGGLAYWVAVVRETFEEAGLLLADRVGGPDLLAGDPEEEARFAAARAAVNAGTLRFLDVCREERLQLGVSDIHYFAHWITPRGAPRRYDTRFFVAAAPPGQIAAHDAGETIAEVWISPHDALERHRAGEIEIIFPTIRNLQVIGRFATSGELLAAAARASSAVPTIEPRVVPDGNGMRIVLPGDPAYERPPVADPGDGTARGDFNEAVRAVSMRANEEGPDAAPARAPASRDPGGARLRHRPRARAGPRRRSGTGPAAAHGAQPGPHDRAGHQHLPGRAGRPGRRRPRPGRRVTHRGHRGRGRSAGVRPGHRRDPHPRRPCAGRRRPGRGHRGPGGRLRPGRGFEPDECVDEGWSLRCGGPGPGAGLTLRALHTPGHASDHLCWLVEEHALLLTGDHVMHGSTVVIRPPDGDLHQYLASLARVRDARVPIRTLGPGHGRLMDHVPDVVDALIAHRLGRHERVAAALGGRGEGTVDELLPEVYGDVTEPQLPVARFALWAHLRALGEEGRATLLDAAEGEDVMESRWAAA